VSTTGPQVSVADRASPEARCAFCHDELGADEFSTCPGCKTSLHPECRAQLAECPTLGCRFSLFSLQPPGPRRHRRPRPAFRRALKNMAQRNESNRLRPIELLDPDARALRMEAMLARDPLELALVRLTVAPFSLLAFAGAFVLGFVPAFWVERLLPMDSRTRPLLRWLVRDRFFTESALAPFVALGTLALGLTLDCPDHVTKLAMLIGAVVLAAPAALVWWLDLARCRRGEDEPSVAE
jgi:hypothetical protein